MTLKLPVVSEAFAIFIHALQAWLHRLRSNNVLILHSAHSLPQQQRRAVETPRGAVGLGWLSYNQQQSVRVMCDLGGLGARRRQRSNYEK